MKDMSATAEQMPGVDVNNLAPTSDSMTQAVSRCGHVTFFAKFAFHAAGRLSRECLDFHGFEWFCCAGTAPAGACCTLDNSISHEDGPPECAQPSPLLPFLRRSTYDLW
ncbi:hypothetical protein F2P81_019460 [Scophthalmus maximus]|uniref:Uncharacterized protein n=1 Tax=Scophthalmus maximus TaxID=52904 RepID=A0A6A4S210_SCOMX|nr:hypothetical protein F2P81_019460 [Scophthalmus maximus]